MTARLFVATGLVAGLFLAGCGRPTSSQAEGPQAMEAAETPETPVAARTTPSAEAAEPARPAPVPAVQTSGPKVAFRINCGATEPYTDAAGKMWVADQEWDAGKTWGADDGLTVDRGNLGIVGTDAPRVYEVERYSMYAYKFAVPNGKYTVRLHFAETYDGIMGADERVFSVSINGREVLQDLDVFEEAGGSLKPLAKEFRGIPVEDGQLTIGFAPSIQNPEINGIEILSE